MSKTDQGLEGFAADFGQPGQDIRSTGLDNALDGFRRAALDALDTLFDRIDRDALERAVLALAEARSVLVLGTYSTRLLASYLHHVASLRFRNWHMAYAREGARSSVAETLTDADVVVAIAFAPDAADTVEVARHARSVGARVIGITDGRTSPLVACANDVLLLPVPIPSVLWSGVGATALAEMLVGMVATRNAGTTGALIAERESDRSASGARRRE